MRCANRGVSRNTCGRSGVSCRPARPGRPKPRAGGGGGPAHRTVTQNVHGFDNLHTSDDRDDLRPRARPCSSTPSTAARPGLSDSISSAAANSSRGTASPSRKSRISVPVSPGVPTARRGGVVSPRSSAARASGPRRAATRSTVNSIRSNAVRKPRHNRASGTTTPSVTAMSESGRLVRGTHAIVTLQPQWIIAALAATPPIAPLPRAGKCVTVRTHKAHQASMAPVGAP